ncbi:hypothetical protein [Comamonas aquatica]|nr:hypothetical protein [Comamonas aquatica]QTX22574.1 hypothetical protein KAQ61_09310 [Comamonas aquatica]
MQNARMFRAFFMEGGSRKGNKKGLDCSRPFKLAEGAAVELMFHFAS